MPKSPTKPKTSSSSSKRFASRSPGPTSKPTTKPALKVTSKPNSNSTSSSHLTSSTTHTMLIPFSSEEDLDHPPVKSKTTSTGITSSNRSAPARVGGHTKGGDSANSTASKAHLSTRYARDEDAPRTHSHQDEGMDDDNHKGDDNEEEQVDQDSQAHCKTVISESQLEEMSKEDMMLLLQQHGVSIGGSSSAGTAKRQARQNGVEAGSEAKRGGVIRKSRRRSVSFGTVQHHHLSPNVIYDEEGDGPGEDGNGGELEEEGDDELVKGEDLEDRLLSQKELEMVDAEVDQVDDVVNVPLLPSAEYWQEEIVHDVRGVVADTLASRNELTIHLDTSRAKITREEELNAFEGFDGTELALSPDSDDATGRDADETVKLLKATTIQRTITFSDQIQTYSIASLSRARDRELIRQATMKTTRDEMVEIYCKELGIFEVAEKALRECLAKQAKLEAEFQAKADELRAKHIRKYLEVTDPVQIQNAIEDAELAFLQQRKQEREIGGKKQLKKSKRA